MTKSKKGGSHKSGKGESVKCPHLHFKEDIIDRNVISKQQYLDLLCTPKGYRWQVGDGEPKPFEEVMAKGPRKIVCSGRRLRKPERTYVHNFLAEVWALLTPEMVDRLKGMLMNEFGMTPEEARKFIADQREANISKSSTVSLYKKSRKLKDGTIVTDTYIKMRTPNKSFCYKYPKSNIGVRNSWVKDLSDILSGKMTSYVMDTVGAERNERQQQIADTLLDKFNNILEQQASMTNPKTTVHKAMATAADRLSLWLEKNVKMAKKTANRLKVLQEELERREWEGEEEVAQEVSEKEAPDEMDEEEIEDAEEEGEGGVKEDATKMDVIAEEPVEGEGEMPPAESPEKMISDDVEYEKEEGEEIEGTKYEEEESKDDKEDKREGEEGEEGVEEIQAKEEDEAEPVDQLDEAEQELEGPEEGVEESPEKVAEETFEKPEEEPMKEEEDEANEEETELVEEIAEEIEVPEEEVDQPPEIGQPTDEEKLEVGEEEKEEEEEEGEGEAPNIEEAEVEPKEPSSEPTSEGQKEIIVLVDDQEEEEVDETEEEWPREPAEEVDVIEGLEEPSEIKEPQEKAKESPEAVRDEIISAIVTAIDETEISPTPFQESIKDVVGKRLEEAVGEKDPEIIAEVAGKVGTWMEQTVHEAEKEREERAKSSPVTGRSPIFQIKRLPNSVDFNVEPVSLAVASMSAKAARGSLVFDSEPINTKKWAEWATSVTDVAHLWADWIENTVDEAQIRSREYKEKENVDFNDWGKFKEQKGQDAIEWRKQNKQLTKQAETWDRKVAQQKK